MKDLYNMIEEAFVVENKPVMDDEGLLSLDWEQRQVVKFFNGKDLNMISIQNIKKHGSSLDPTALLSLLPLDYYKYYFSSFLTLSLKHCKEIDILCDSIVYSFHLKFADGSNNKLAHDRLEQMSIRQLNVCKNYLDYMKQKYVKIIDEWGIDNAKSSIETVLKSKSGA